MDIKDLAGLSEPLTRLIEVISGGIGNVSESYLITHGSLIQTTDSPDCPAMP